MSGLSIFLSIAIIGVVGMELKSQGLSKIALLTGKIMNS